MIHMHLCVFILHLGDGIRGVCGAQSDATHHNPLHQGYRVCGQICSRAAVAFVDRATKLLTLTVARS